MSYADITNILVDMYWDIDENTWFLRESCALSAFGRFHRRPCVGKLGTLWVICVCMLSASQRENLIKPAANSGKKVGRNAGKDAGLARENFHAPSPARIARWWTTQFWFVIGVRPWQHGHDPREGPLSWACSKRSRSSAAWLWLQRPSMAGWTRPQNTYPVSHMPYIVAQDDLTHPNPMWMCLKMGIPIKWIEIAVLMGKHTMIKHGIMAMGAV